MNILIVDDQNTILCGIQKNINWHSIPSIEQVYYADNAADAMDHIYRKSIDILVTDIEMPGEDGLALIRRALTFQNDLLCIVLTSHASFQYAKTALKLGCYDYILQPVEYDALRSSVERAAFSLLEKRQDGTLIPAFSEEQNDNDFTNYTSHPHIRKKIRKLLADFYAKKLTAQELVTQASQYHFTLSLTDFYIIAVRQIIRYSLSMENQLDELNDTILTDLSAQNAYFTCRHTLETDSFHSIMLFHCKADADLSNDYLYSSLSLVVDKLLKQQQIALAFYLSTPCLLTDLPETFPAIKAAEDMNISGFSAVFLYNSTSFIQPKNSPIGKNWMEWISQGNTKSVVDEINNYLQLRADNGTLNGNILIAIQQKFVHALYGAFDLKNVSLHTLFKDEKYLQSYMRALTSSENLLQFVTYACEMYEQFTGIFSAKPEVIIDKIKLYIDQNLDTMLSRKTIAEHFFMSEDYLSHLFKRETGHPLSNYITNMRISRAKTLLSSTELSVGVIALKVGFNDFSYFSKAFKLLTNMTPNEYRKKQAP